MRKNTNIRIFFKAKLYRAFQNNGLQRIGCQTEKIIFPICWPNWWQSYQHTIQTSMFPLYIIICYTDQCTLPHTHLMQNDTAHYSYIRLLGGESGLSLIMWPCGVFYFRSITGILAMDWLRYTTYFIDQCAQYRSKGIKDMRNE